MQGKIRVVSVLTAMLMWLSLSGQFGLSSPYTAKGIGYSGLSQNLSLQSMGGISQGVRNPGIVNYKNPASLTSIDTLSFVFEGGFYMRYNTLKTTDNSEKTSTASMTHLLFGFPVTGWWKSSFGLLPFSQVGYNIIDTDVDPLIGRVTHIYQGEGGINRVFWGNGISFGKHFSFGFNISYLFGTIDKYQTILFPDSAYVLNSRLNNTISINDFSFDFGLQAYYPLGANLSLSAGLTYGLTSDIKAKRDYLGRSFLGTISNIEIFRDTILFNEGEKGIMRLPGFFGGGFVIEKKNKWMAGMDFEYNKWSEFSLYEQKDQYVDSYKISAGGQYSPDRLNGIRYYERIQYRLGFYYGRSNLYIRDNYLDDFGITFGLGLPLLKSDSMINFAIKTGRLGKTSDNLIRENYIEFSAGISLKEYWFFKRNYY